MNTADRSIALMEVALRRRFKFEELMPDAGVINRNEPLGQLVVDLFNTLNKRIRFLYDRDPQLGHSYFLNVNSLEDLRLVFVDRVIPLLQEYFYGDWHKICIVLGCPYSEDGTQNNEDGTQNNEDGNKNISDCGKLTRSEKRTRSASITDEYEDRVDFEVSEKFLKNKMNDDDLASTFLGVLQLEEKEV